MRGIIIRRPDDMHFHPRSGNMLRMVLPYTSRVFARGVVMGNLSNPVVTGSEAIAYQREIKSIDPLFTPIMTIMLTNRTTPRIVEDAFNRGIKVIKYIPKNVSTNSEEGISLEELLRDYYPVLKMAQRLKMIFSAHWEDSIENKSRSKAINEMNREARAIQYLKKVHNSFPKLKIVAEHASSCELINFVEKASDKVAATLTIHHAILNIEDVMNSNGTIHNPHHYCRPIAKAEIDRLAVVRTMVNGNPKFFFGSDSAPHPMSAKEADPPVAGIFTAPVALPLLCEIFEEHGALQKLENFVSVFGARFYGLPLNDDEVVIRRKEWKVLKRAGNVKIFKGGETLRWQVNM